MYSAFLLRTKEAISQLEKHIRASDRFRTLVFDGALKCVSVAPCFDQAIVSTDAFADRTHWRIIDHCTAVTRIYAIYENFTHEMIREHLAFLQSRLAFSELPDAVRSSYRLGVAKILEKKAGPRFGDIDLAQLIGGYDKALSGKDYTLEPRAMLMQEQNLRLLELQRLMNACGVEGSVDWIEQHREVRNFFETNNRLAASAGSEMAELIKYRNDAAHGTLDIGDILHANVLIEFCHFVAAVCEALAEKVQLAGLECLRQHSQVGQRGSVTKSLKGDTVAIGVMTGTFQVGSTVYLCGATYCLERRIMSLQLEGVSYERVDLVTATALGIELDAPGKKNSVLMMIE
ncbi:MAG: hypothetical protein ING16_00125 [Roseomonas sp.]|nr:hypothetical protein [Roseomonas sp.]